MDHSTEAPEAQIIRSWNINAAPWAKAVRSGSIRSRTLVTDRAIVDATLSVGAKRVLDLGCGEGWLARALCASGMEVTGLDAVPELIDEAARLGGGDFQVQEYRALAERRFRGGPFNAAVCNFSLLGGESVAALLAALRDYLDTAGHLVIQTLHPRAACGAHPYRDGWRAGTWTGFGGEFSDPAPWYFRTLESWHSLLADSGFDLLESREPCEPGAPGTSAPLSVIFIGRLRGPRTDRSGD